MMNPPGCRFEVMKRSRCIEHRNAIVLRIDHPDVAVRAHLYQQRPPELARSAAFASDGSQVTSIGVEDSELLRLPLQHVDAAGLIHLERCYAPEQVWALLVEAADPQLFDDAPC